MAPDGRIITREDCTSYSLVGETGAQWLKVHGESVAFLSMYKREFQTCCYQGRPYDNVEKSDLDLETFSYSYQNF